MRAVTIASIVLMAAFPVAAEEATKPVAFPTSVKVVVDASGKPAVVEPDARLPEPVRQHLKEHVGSWLFEPPVEQGAAVEAVTYVALGVCVAASATDPERLNLGVSYRSHGPRPATGRLPPPRYPVGAAKAGQSAEMQVAYIVQPDGKARLEGIDYIAGGDTAARRKPFDAAIKEWVHALRYEPEQIAGQPVSTRIRTPVDFWVEPHVSTARREAREADRTLALSECAAAVGADDKTQPVVLDSRVQLVSSGT